MFKCPYCDSPIAVHYKGPCPECPEGIMHSRDVDNEILVQYAVFLTGKGYYAKKQPTYEYCWTHSINEANLYGDVSRMDEVMRKMKLTCEKEGFPKTNIEIHTVETVTAITNKTQPFDDSHLNTTYEDDGTNFICTIIDTGTRRKFTGKHPRYKTKAYKQAYSKYVKSNC